MNDPIESLKGNIIEVSKALSDHLTKSQIYGFIRQNEYEKAGPGIYVSPDSFADELLILHKRCPQGVISHDEALYYHGLVDREPMSHTLTVYSGYNSKRLVEAGYKTYYCKRELLEQGKIIVKTNQGNTVPMYNMERTIVDLIRNRSQFEMQDFTTALRTYVGKKEKNLPLLYEYAAAFRVENVLRGYLEVLL